MEIQSEGKIEGGTVKAKYRVASLTRVDLKSISRLEKERKDFGTHCTRSISLRKSQAASNCRRRHVICGVNTGESGACPLTSKLFATETAESFGRRAVLLPNTSHTHNTLLSND